MNAKSSFSNPSRLTENESRFCLSTERKIIKSLQDESGINITPLSLLNTGSEIRRSRRSRAQSSADNGSMEQHLSPVLNYSDVPMNVRTPPHLKMNVKSSTNVAADEDAFINYLTEVRQKFVFHSSESPQLDNSYFQKRRAKQKIYDEEETISIDLEETETISMLEIIGKTPDGTIHPDIFIVKNELYAQLCSNRQNTEKYYDSAMCTVNALVWKDKETVTSKVTYSDAGTMCCPEEMVDAQPEEAEEAVAAAESLITINKIIEQDNLEPDEWVRMKNDCLQQLQMSLLFMERIVVQNNKHDKIAYFHNLPSYKFEIDSPEESVSLSEEDSVNLESERLAIKEQAISSPSTSKCSKISNISSTAHLSAATITDIEYIVDDNKPRVELLWTLSCDLTEGFCTTSIALNKKNNNLVAVSYGPPRLNENKGGLICGWNIKNIEYPERHFNVPSGVTTLSFSTSFPHMLACGTYNGYVLVYDVRFNQSTPILNSFESKPKFEKQEEKLNKDDSSTTNQSESKRSKESVQHGANGDKLNIDDVFRKEISDTEDGLNLDKGTHTGPTWQVHWIERERATGDDRRDTLLSIGADGHVTHWLIKKGFEFQYLMKIKRNIQTTRSGQGKEVNAILDDTSLPITHLTGGLCCDAWPDYNERYIIGTEDGLIHRCSCSYSEQFLATYTGHTGPVYRLEWSPFNSSLFISASGDWKVGLWVADQTEPLKMYEPTLAGIKDVCWSPHHPTVFACITNSLLFIYDIGENLHEPILVYQCKEQDNFESTRTSKILKSSFSTTKSTLKLISPDKYWTCVKFASVPHTILIGDSKGNVSMLKINNLQKPDESKLGYIITELLSTQEKNKEKQRKQVTIDKK